MKAQEQASLCHKRDQTAKNENNVETQTTHDHSLCA